MEQYVGCLPQCETLAMDDVAVNFVGNMAHVRTVGPLRSCFESPARGYRSTRTYSWQKIELLLLDAVLQETPRYFTYVRRGIKYRSPRADSCSRPKTSHQRKNHRAQGAGDRDP